MKLRNIVITTVIALSIQTVNADCETAKSIGAKGGGATGAFVGGALGTAAVGGLTAACAAALAAAPVTFGASLIAAASSCGAAFLGIGTGATFGGIFGSTDGEQVAKIICDSRRNVSFGVGEVVLVDNFKGIVVDINHTRKRMRLMVLVSGDLIPVELDISRIAKLK